MTTDRLVAIHQPNFMPWIGFFDKIARADCMVLLDHVRMNPKQSWLSRVQVMNQEGPRWLTVPTVAERENSSPCINQVKIRLDSNFQSKHLRTLEYNYRTHEYFGVVFPLLKSYYLTDEPLLARRNISLISALCRLLDISTPLVLSSSLDCKTHATDALIEIVKKVGGSTYLCGGGAAGYQEDEKFRESGIQLQYQNFQHPIYPQPSTTTFVNGLSIIDMLMCCGPNHVKAVFNPCAPSNTVK